MCNSLLKLRGNRKVFWALMKWKHHQHHWKCNFENHAKMQKKIRAASLQSSISSHIQQTFIFEFIWFFLDFQSILFKLFVFKGFVRDDNDEKQSFALRKSFLFLLELVLDLLWPNMEKVKVWWYYWYTTMVVKTGKTAFVFLSVTLEMRNLPFFDRERLSNGPKSYFLRGTFLKVTSNVTFSK